MGCVIVFENPAAVSDFKEFEHTGPFIDFLLKHYPHGFEGRSHIVAVNGLRLTVEDYDRPVGQSDRVALAILPAAPVAVFAALGPVWSVVAATVVNMVIATVLNFAINKFFGPKGTAPTSTDALSGGLGAASPTYSLNVPTNVARLGQPIPVAYGSNLLVPDLAAAPYSVYRENQQYITLILCMGQGEFNIDEIYASNTAFSAVGTNTAVFWQFGPQQHLAQFGTIQQHIRDSEPEGWAVFENLLTVADVTDQELVSGAVGEGLSFTTCTILNAAHARPGAPEGEPDLVGGWFYLPSSGINLSDAYLRDSLWVTVSGADTLNNGVYKVTYFADQGSDAFPEPWKMGTVTPVSALPDDPVFTWLVSHDEATLTFSFSEPEVGAAPAGVPIGPYFATPRGVETSYLQYDYEFPGGCYDVSAETGSAREYTVSISFFAEPIQLHGDAVTGTGYTFTVLKTMNTTTAQRLTAHHHVPKARYRVTGFRTTPKSTNAGAQSNVHWTALKAVLNTPGPAYGDVTLLVIRAKASEGLSSDALSRISVRCSRYDPKYLTLSRNPADAFRDIFTNQIYGGRRPVSELDWPTYSAAKARWEAEGRTFDAVYDTKTTLWDAMGMALQGVYTAPTMVGSKLSLVEDINHTVPWYALDKNNIKSLSVTFVFPEGEEVDGVEVEFRDPDDNAAVFAYYPDTSVNPEKVSLFGCRDYEAALAYATRRWKQLSLRRLLITVETELDADIISVGAPIKITHPNLNWGVPTLCIANSIKATGEFGRVIELHRHEPGIYPPYL